MRIHIVVGLAFGCWEGRRCKLEVIAASVGRSGSGGVGGSVQGLSGGDRLARLWGVSVGTSEVTEPPSQSCRTTDRSTARGVVTLVYRAVLGVQVPSWAWRGSGDEHPRSNGQ